MTDRIAIVKSLIKEKENLNQIIKQAEKRVRNAPEGTVRIIDHGNGVQFYYRKNPSDKSGTYMPASERETAIKLIQKRYDLQIIKAAEKQRKCIDGFLNKYDPDRLMNIYSLLGEKRKPFIKAAELPDKEYKERWLNVQYSGKEFKDGTAEHYTAKGERVRSKSEVLIADALNRAGIPYRYEYPLELGGRIIHPDFTVLRMSDRKEVYWEHLGGLDDSTYRNDAITRIVNYERDGICIGERLFITFETYKLPLNMNSVNVLVGRLL